MSDSSILDWCQRRKKTPLSHHHWQHHIWSTVYQTWAPQSKKDMDVAESTVVKGYKVG